ncbi:MAG TPA: hypothetical protein VNK24_01980 [Elusimicrobiota bacterium]|nr:hypothetical protein [Elusimicrobiota bacterium]
MQIVMTHFLKSGAVLLMSAGELAAAGWALIAMAEVFADFTMSGYRLDVRDNLTVRKMETQVRVLRRVVSVIVVIVTGSIMPMTIPAG